VRYISPIIPNHSYVFHMDPRIQPCTAVHVQPSYQWTVHVSGIGSNHTTSNGSTCFSLFSIALHTTNVNRHSSIPRDMQPNARCHKCPILPLYRLTNLSTDSPNTFTSFTWIHAHNHALQFTFSHLTSGPSTSATSVGSPSTPCFLLYTRRAPVAGTAVPALR
jgi:hypothetical protein